MAHCVVSLQKFKILIIGKFDSVKKNGKQNFAHLQSVFTFITAPSRQHKHGLLSGKTFKMASSCWNWSTEKFTKQRLKD